jgi:hypothetical protein
VTEEEIIEYLESNGYPAHIVSAGRKGIVQRWREFVTEVENGYPYGLHEYRHDLDLRGAIALLGLEGDVAEADERFAALLTGREIRVWESGAGDPWWDFGYPKNSSGRLLRDLRQAGLDNA